MLVVSCGRDKVQGSGEQTHGHRLSLSPCPSAGCQEPCGHIQHRPDHTSTQEGAGGTNMSQAEGTAEPSVCPGEAQALHGDPSLGVTPQNQY